MTGPLTGDLAVDDLGVLGSELGRGGQAVIFEAPNLVLPDVSAEVVYKQYFSGQEPHRQGMRSLIGLRNRLDTTLRATLDAIAAWPLRLVLDGDVVRGVVLPRIPGSYFQDAVLPGTGRRTSTVREVQHLFVDEERCRRIGMPVASHVQRLAILRDFAAALAFLHQPGVDVVFGDINARNVLYRFDGQPMTMLVDCDAARLKGMMSKQLNAPDWEPPAGAVLNRQTDLYKLALLVLRLLTPGDQASTRTDPAAAAGVLDAEGLALLTAALRDHPEDPPPAAEWFRYLTRVLGLSTEPPVLETVDLDRTMVAAGEPVRLRWSGQYVETVEVSGAGIVPVIANGDAGELSVRPVHTSALTVRADNKFGSCEWITRPVAVVTIPRFDDLAVPLPRLAQPDVGLTELPEIAALLPLPPFLPSADLPVLPALTGVLRGPREIQPALPQASIDADGGAVPIDIASIMTAAPGAGAGPRRGDSVR